MGKREKAEEKEIKFNEILKRIKEGELESIPYNGNSPAWKIFNKIRFVKEPTKFVEFVQCKKCKVLRAFTSQNGTSTLQKHECKTKADENDVVTFKDISPEKADETKDILLQNSMELCAEDVISIETISGNGFLKFAQGLVAIGEREGSISLQPLLPTKTGLSHYIRNFKNQEQRKAEENLHEAIENKYCSITMNLQASYDGDTKLIVNIIYLDNDLTALTKTVIFTISVDVDGNTDKIREDIQKKFKIFRCDERLLKDIHVVTPKEDIFVDILKDTCPRIDCAAFIINSVLKSFSGNNEISEVLFDCKGIVSYLTDTEKNLKLKFPVVEDNGTWQSKVAMVNFLYTHYNEVFNLLSPEKQNEFKNNKKLAEELAKVLEVFAEAIIDLQSSVYPTSNKILLWWSVLKDHLNSNQKYLAEIKNAMAYAKILFNNEFLPTMDQKVACFLDPRYRQLKMLSKEERKTVVKEVKRIINNMCARPVTNTAAASAEVSSAPPAKKSKFTHLEANEDDIAEKDEVDTYIHSTELRGYNLKESEFNVIGKFWKNNKSKLPKLFELATTRLHVPACCCSNENKLNLKTTADPEVIDDLLFIRDKL